MAHRARNGGAEPTSAGPQGCSSPAHRPHTARLHALLCCPAGAVPRSSPGDRRIPRQPSGGGCAPPSPLSQPGGAVEESGAVSQRPPAPRAVLHVEAQQVVQHRLPEGGNGEELRRPRCCCAGGPQPPPPPQPVPPVPGSPPLSPGPLPSALPARPPPPIPAPRPLGPSPVVPAEHVDGVPVGHHGVFAAPAGGTERRSAAPTAAPPPPHPPSPPPRRSPGTHELIAGREAAPAVHRLEGPEVEGEVLDAVRAAVVEVYARSHLRAPRAARGGPGRRHGAASPAGLRLPACTATAAPEAAERSAPDCSSQSAPRGGGDWPGGRGRARGREFEAPQRRSAARRGGRGPARLEPAACGRSEAVLSVKSFYSLIQKKKKKKNNQEPNREHA